MFIQIVYSDCVLIESLYRNLTGDFHLQNSNLSIFPKKQTLFCFRGILFRQLKTIRCSEAAYNEREIKPVPLSCIPSSLQPKQKQAFCFKGKVRKICQYILLSIITNNYKKSNCNKRNWMLAGTYSLKRQHAIVLHEHTSSCLHLILLHFHLLTPS